MRTTHLGLLYDFYLNGRHIAGPTHNPHELYETCRNYCHHLAAGNSMTVWDTALTADWHAAGVAAGTADIAGDREKAAKHHAECVRLWPLLEAPVQPSDSHRWEIRQTDEDSKSVTTIFAVDGNPSGLPEKIAETEYDRRCEAARLERLKAG